jgi:hypothetical protein
MPRVAVTLAVFAVIAIATACALVEAFGARLLDEGRGLYSYRDGITSALEAVPSPDVLWLGDSTIMSIGSRRSYARLFGERVLARRERRSAIIAVPGLDFFGYYALMGPALATKPRVVVMIANLRLLDPRGMRPRGDLVSFVPAKELPRLLTLPYASRSMTAPGLLLARLLRFGPLATTTFLFEGARRTTADAEWWAMLGPELPSSDDWSYEERHHREMVGHLREYAREIGPGHPTMRFAAAAVEMAVREGTRVVVIVTPVPFDALRANGLLDRERMAASISTIRGVVSAAGGILVDLHAALRGDELRDADAHFTQPGVEHMVQLVRMPIASALGDLGLATDVVVPGRDRPVSGQTAADDVSR